MPGAPTATTTTRDQPRRRAILEATVRLLGAEGVGEVTHRRVAREAGVPLAATTYYFDSKDDLLRQALDLVVAGEFERFTERAAQIGREFSSPHVLGRALAGVLIDYVERERETLLTKFDVYLAAARQPSLRPASRRWIESFTGLAEAALGAAGVARPEEAARLLVAGADGLLIHHLATSGKRADTRALRARLERLADTLIAAARAPEPTGTLVPLRPEEQT